MMLPHTILVMHSDLLHRTPDINEDVSELAKKEKKYDKKEKKEKKERKRKKRKKDMGE
jgi:hypothetical protein